MIFKMHVLGTRHQANTETLSYQKEMDLGAQLLMIWIRIKKAPSKARWWLEWVNHRDGDTPTTTLSRRQRKIHRVGDNELLFSVLGFQSKTRCGIKGESISNHFTVFLHNRLILILLHNRPICCICQLSGWTPGASLLMEGHLKL